MSGQIGGEIIPFMNCTAEEGKSKLGSLGMAVIALQEQTPILVSPSREN